MANKIKFEIPNYSNAVEKAVFNAVTRLGYRVEEEAKTNALVDTGAYRDGIKFNGKDEITANIEYSAAIEYGVQPRIITVKTAKALRFVLNGKIVFAKSVKLPARRPNPIMRNAGKTVQKEVTKIFNEEFERV